MKILVKKTKRRFVRWVKEFRRTTCHRTNGTSVIIEGSSIRNKQATLPLS